ncbi:MAG: ATP-binding protein [Thermoanaerobacterium thermosaccharolyticum]|jgi:hypothetical protein
MFGKKESKEEKEQREIQKFLDKYQLNDMDEKDLEMAKIIGYDLAGTGWLETGMIFTGKSEDLAKISYLKAIFDQNWIIIRKLSDISKKLDNLGHRE